MSVSCLRYNLKRNSFMIEKYTIFTDYLREKFPRYDTYLSEISDSKKTLKNFNEEITKLIVMFKNITKEEIKFKDIYKDHENYLSMD